MLALRIIPAQCRKRVIFLLIIKTSPFSGARGFTVLQLVRVYTIHTAINLGGGLGLRQARFSEFLILKKNKVTTKVTTNKKGQMQNT